MQGNVAPAEEIQTMNPYYPCNQEENPLYTPTDGQPYPYQHARYQPGTDTVGNILVNHTIGTILGNQEDDTVRDDIEALLGDKKRLLWSRIELLLLQLKERQYIGQSVSYRIEQDLCRADTILMEMNARKYGINKERIQLERIKFDLFKQKRMEETSCFKDTGMLNSDLIETLIWYLDQVQKEKIIGTEGEP